MTSLIERCQDAYEDLAKIELARRNAHARSQVQERAREWGEHVARLSLTLERAEWAGLIPEEVSPFLIKREQLRKNATDASARLSAGEDVSHLTADALWTRLLQSTTSATDSLEEAVKARWQASVQEEGALAAPAELKAKIEPTPPNRQALADYAVPYANYRRLAGYVMPRSAQDKEALQSAVAQCRAELAKLDYDVPADVAAFFRAVDSSIATLASLTPEVLRWLRDNGQLDRYVVRSAGQ